MVVTDAQRHGYRDSTRLISRCGSNNRAYLSMVNLMNLGLRPGRHPKSPHGKGTTSMDTSSKRKRRTRRAHHRTVRFDMRASTRPLRIPRHTMGSLRTYGNLTMAVNYRYPSSGASGSSQMRLPWMRANHRGAWKCRVQRMTCLFV